MSLKQLYALARELYDQRFPCPICEVPVNRQECAARRAPGVRSSLPDLHVMQWQCPHCEAWHYGDGEVLLGD